MKRGTYTYSHATRVYPTLQFATFEIRVEIIGESETKYHVKYVAYHMNKKHGPGYKTWVGKDKVKIDGETRTPIDKDTRLPYKD